MQLVDLAGKKVAMLGAGREGAALIAALASAGVACDLALLAETGDARPVHGVPVQTGAFTADALARFDILVRSPGICLYRPELAAATARVGVALADLFPGLTLNGSAGNSSDVVSDLLSSDTFVFSIVANLAGTLFDGGRRRAAVEGARARAEGATAEYAGTVLTALREVEDALVREATWRRQLTFLEKRLVEARAADAIARSRYRRGVEELLGVLETERRLRAAEDSLTGARSALWNARIDLHLALGGDWGTAPPAQSSRARQDPTGEEASKRQESSKRQHGTHTLPELDKTPTENF